MEKDTPQTIALEVLRLITSIQKNQSICQNKEEYDFLINISGIHALLTLTMECSFPYLIELSQELDQDITTELKTNYNPSENTVCNKSEMGKILYFPKSFPEK